MIPIFKSLDQISTGYTVFEADQVLTHEQLNSLADYADDQIRISRTKLIGVGLVCGLHPSLDGDVVTVTKGSGVTTDGDLVFLNADTEFTKFKVYDESYPAYPPLYQGGNVNNPMIPVFELLTDDTTDPLAQPLSTFAVEAGMPLSSAIAVILMESYLKDDDICSGTDCDNLGKEAKHRIKILLVDSDGADALLENVPTAGDAFEMLNELVVDRPVVTSAITTPALLAALYRNSCTNINTSLQTALSAIYPACSSLIGDIFPSDPSGAWIVRLNQIRTAFAGSDTRIQYYYDFLKDVVDTYNAFRNLLFAENIVCSPDTASFPKHLLLGDLAIAGIDFGEYRTAFYPSPALCCKGRSLDHAKFLLRKIDLLINTFDVNVATPAIRIIPSLFEDRPLEERAIPYYYPATGGTLVHRKWNFDLYWKRMSTSIQSYNAADYSGPTTPLRSQLGRYNFFRIEGHLGQNVTTATNAIKAQIKANNLPFTVRAVHAGTSRTGVTVKPAIRYNDLHRLHYVMRQDLVMQLDDLTRFSGTFKDKVFAEPATLAMESEECNCAPRTFATTTSATLNSNVATTRALLDRSYTTYAADTSWHQALGTTLVTAGQYKSNLGAVAKTDFVTPVDTLISSPHVNLLPGLDTLIKKKEEAEDDKLLLSNFIDGNPAAEHFAGVVRGGTFILVYDTSNNVVADFMLPYYWEEQAETAVSEPSLTRPAIKTNYVLDNGVKVLPSRTAFVAGKIDTFSTGFTAAVNNTIDTQLTFQNRYVDLFQSSIDVLGGAAPRVDQARYADAAYRTANATEVIASQGGGGGPVYGDPFLTESVNENNHEAGKINVLKAKAEEAAGTEIAQWYLGQLKVVEREVADSTMGFVDYLAAQFRYNPAAGYDVSPGSDAANAAGVITDNLALLTDRSVKDALRTALNNVNGQVNNEDFHALTTAMIDMLA